LFGFQPALWVSLGGKLRYPEKNRPLRHSGRGDETSCTEFLSGSRDGCGQWVCDGVRFPADRAGCAGFPFSVIPPGVVHE